MKKHVRRSMKAGIRMILERYADVLADDPLDDEVAEGNGYWFYLKPGFISASDETHFVHEDTIAECYGKLAHVKPCSCDDCKRSE